MQDARNLIRYGGMRARPRLAAVRLRASYGLVEYLRTLAMLKEHGWSPRRCIPHGGHQLSLNIAAGLGLGGNESYPDVFQPFGGFADETPVEDSYVRMPDVPGVGFEAKNGALQGDEGAGELDDAKVGQQVSRTSPTPSTSANFMRASSRLRRAAAPALRELAFELFAALRARPALAAVTGARSCRSETRRAARSRRRTAHRRSPTPSTRRPAARPSRSSGTRRALPPRCRARSRKPRMRCASTAWRAAWSCFIRVRRASWRCVGSIPPRSRFRVRSARAGDLHAERQARRPGEDGQRDGGAVHERPREPEHRIARRLEPRGASPGRAGRDQHVVVAVDVVEPRAAAVRDRLRLLVLRARDLRRRRGCAP